MDRATQLPAEDHINQVLYLSLTLLLPPVLAVRAFKRALLFCATALLASWWVISSATQWGRDWLYNTLPAGCEGIPLTLTLQIEDVAVVVDGQGRVNAIVLPGQQHDCGRLPQRISLGWSTDTGHADKTQGQSSSANAQTISWSPVPGERWRIDLTLRRPIATLNFDGFDVHRYWMEQGIHALGRVTPPPRGTLQRVSTTEPGLNLPLWRQQLAQRITNALPEETHPFQGILQGLSVGLQKHITPGKRQLNLELTASKNQRLTSVAINFRQISIELDAVRKNLRLHLSSELTDRA